MHHDKRELHVYINTVSQVNEIGRNHPTESRPTISHRTISFDVHFRCPLHTIT